MLSRLYNTTVVHQRFYPFKHKFKYYLLSMCINYDELELLSKKLKIFSYNKFNIFSFYDKDHGYRDNRSLRDFVEKFLNKYNLKFDNLTIKIVCFPRVFGYVFNPLSIIYCYDKSNLIAIFYEVKNTSNEQHTYCFGSLGKKNYKEYNHKCNKNFYVSPFIGMKGSYKFRNTLSIDSISIIIDLYDEKNKKILTATQYGKKTSLKSLTFMKQLIYNPLLTFKIIIAILYQALLIYFKGGKYYNRKKKFLDTITFEGEL